MSGTSDPQEAAQRALHGVAASPGIGVGRAWLLLQSTAAERVAAAGPLPPGAREAERALLQQALQQARTELAELAAGVRTRLGGSEAAIFEAQALFLQDPALLDPMDAAVRIDGTSAEAAVKHVLAAAEAELTALDDPRLQARAVDLRDLAERVVRWLRDSNTGPRVPQPVAGATVIVAHDLTPSAAAGLQPESVRGIVLEAGTTVGHAAILARSLAIPLVAGVGPDIWQIKQGQEVLVDGTAGLVLVQPTNAARSAVVAHTPTAIAGEPVAGEGRSAPCLTADGRRVLLSANASSGAEAVLARRLGAEGIGLLRTEFLLAALGDRAQDSQALEEAYGTVLQATAGWPVVVRVLDAGGDKPLPFLAYTAEANPFLGWRGIRVLLDEPTLFRAQVRALLRAAGRLDTDLRILFPMISSLDEFVRARALVESVQRAETPHLAHPLRIGAMIEVPAAALTASALAHVADFFSIGTNDLAQYTLACDRGNARVAPLYSVHHPAVLRLIQMTIVAAHAAKKAVAVCGEAASDPRCVPLLVGLGVDELSVAPAQCAAVRHQVQALHHDRLRAVAAAACALGTAGEVVALLDDPAAFGEL